MSRILEAKRATSPSLGSRLAPPLAAFQAAASGSVPLQSIFCKLGIATAPRGSSLRGDGGRHRFERNALLADQAFDDGEDVAHVPRHHDAAADGTGALDDLPGRRRDAERQLRDALR